MTLAQQTERGESPIQAVCPEHPEQAAVATCERCGRYVCDNCRGFEKQCVTCLRLRLQGLPSSAGRARAAIFCLWAVLAVDALSAVLSAMNLAVPGPGPLRLSLATLLALGEAALRFATAVTFLMWLYRAVKQTEALGLNVGATPGWAVGWWFVPFANLTRPYRVVRKMVVSLGGESLADLLSMRSWWALWVIGNIAGNLQARVARNSADGREGSGYYVISILSSLLSIGAAVLCARIVQQVQTSLESRRDGPT